MNKIVFAVDGVVQSVATIFSSGAQVSCNLDNHEQFQVDSTVDVKEGYTVTKNEDGSVVFNKA
jgi:hypothetical protein